MKKLIISSMILITSITSSISILNQTTKENSLSLISNNSQKIQLQLVINNYAHDIASSEYFSLNMRINGRGYNNDIYIAK